jgi:hypothetical protein
MRYTEAFAKYGAKLRNSQWSICAENEQKELVLSCWQHHFSKPVGNKITCSGNASRWEGPGNTEFRELISKAHATDQVVRAVIARTEDPAWVEAGKDASKLRNTFSIKENWFGKVTFWDGERYEVTFEKR